MLRVPSASVGARPKHGVPLPLKCTLHQPPTVLHLSQVAERNSKQPANQHVAPIWRQCSSAHSRHRSLVIRAQAAPAAAVPQLYTSVAPGKAHPLGPSKTEQGINFALFSRHAKSARLCLFNEKAQQVDEIECRRTGDVFHLELVGLPGSDVRYGFKVAGDGGWDAGHRWAPGKVLLDPYAPLVSGRRRFGVRDEVEQFKGKEGSLFLGAYDFDSPPYDWGPNYRRPGHSLKDLVIYEVPVRCFTADPSSGLVPELRGTFAGLAAKAPYLASLGVNAVELLPVFEWDELEFRRTRNPRDHMTNVWGYSHINFFAPMSRLAAAATEAGAAAAAAAVAGAAVAGGEGAAANGTGNGAVAVGPGAVAKEFKNMVKTLHSYGIEVILDVVYNHTAEADDKDPYTLSFRGIDNKTYYMIDPTQFVQLVNWSGCGNTVNANDPTVNERGRPLDAPPLIRAISKHPLLSQTKLIAEPWDIGMYQVGSFPNWDVWAEWNGRYRDDVRKFIKGDPGMKRAFATRLAGSADLYNNHNRRPYHSINFITAHDGFSLYDLVSYNEKRNDANGEGNRDGTNDNFSWNCGYEGPSSDPGVSSLRQRQIRNYLVALMLSQGTPMIVSGDEVGKTHGGNNNWYGHDNAMAHLQWAEGEPQRDALLRFTSELIKFRRAHPALGREHFLSPADITWHEDNWHNDESRFLAFTLHHREAGDIYAAFNAHAFAVSATLPRPPPGRKWSRVVDTNLPAPKDFTPGGNAGVDHVYQVQAFSSIVLIANPL
ncbi:hypothetical protein VOLCADRAFT_117715 [Volvox carteri f. nagariensis]|uniref:Glycosyl hydrolase family 13 catalytic domain-containing protein n=1 Tax=Volvox carteri f. nagariensis TaxID=3068 RepID=D8TX01_VOLCA|nr:uncharacterized protein VOLCADRAFT_117715 [Volvox carteri f. nagariensis]EFJ47823.1 hypothetical protein VOLCADRAFT_117715 [Volvox carteri f. nagariensis]|eukprot:XP_002950929.1 hypothetical protein VOLCADRAFT_117715 [Volvox carteri f. nagariensis]